MALKRGSSLWLIDCHTSIISRSLGGSSCVSLDLMMYKLLLVQTAIALSISSLHGQPASPAAPIARPQAIYTPMPAYRPEWARQGLKGKGVVLVTIDKETGKVTGARMLESTGSQVLDGAALQAYSQWRFKPGSVTQLKMPIEFKSRPPVVAPSAQRRAPPALVYALLILVGFAVAMMARRRGT
jgi:TonB family protein